MNRKRILVLLAVLCLLLNMAAPVYAENSSPLKISKMGVQVMPEYDASDVLVLYSLTFQNDSAQPYSGEIRFPVPKGTSSNIVTENVNNNDQHVNVRVEDKGDTAEFVWKPLQPIQPKGSYQIHLEYYYNPLPGTGSKSFTYKFLANMPVDQPQVHVYQPLKATDFKMEPVGQALGTDSKGFQVYGINSSSLKPGDKIEFKVSYTKNDPKPSVDPPSASQGAAGGAGQTPPSSKSQLSSAAILVPLAAIVIGIIVIAVRAYGNRETETDNRPVRKSSQKSKQIKNPGESKFAQEKRKLREMLLNGDLSEDMYRELLADLEREYS